MTALGFPGAAYDAWKTTPPTRGRLCCAWCDDVLGDEPGDVRELRAHDVLVCSSACASLFEASQEGQAHRVMALVADAMSDGGDVRVHALLMGGGREARGPVVDWSVDGRLLVVENESTGCDCQVRADNVRRVEVLR